MFILFARQNVSRLSSLFRFCKYSWQAIARKYLRFNILFLVFITVCIFIAGCSQPAPVEPVEKAVSMPEETGHEVIDEDTRIISKLTDGILNCLATNKYQWLKHYTVSDLNGPQVARVLVGDAAFDYNITEWNLSEISISYSADKKAALVSIPVICVARVNPKYGPQTAIFNFQFIYSAQHNRWLLNIK